MVYIGNRYIAKEVQRAVAIPPTSFPTDFRLSTLSQWFWCAERSRHLALGLVDGRPPNIAASQGTELHDLVMTTRMGQRFPWEEEFMDIVDELEQPNYGFKRMLDGYGITGHPDGFQVTIDGEVSLIEHKTTEMTEKSLPFFERFRLPLAEFQVKGYAWVFDGLFQTEPKLRDYRISRTHVVLIWNVNRKEYTCQLMGVYPYTLFPTDVERDLRYAISAYKNPDIIVPPKCVNRDNPWKCKQCPKVSRAICRFYKQWEEKHK